MENKDFYYIEEAHLTLSSSFHGDKVAFAHMEFALNKAIRALKELDSIKKCLFYGKEIGKEYTHFEIDVFSKTCEKLPIWIADIEKDDKDAINLIHGIIGKATEAGELLEALKLTIIDGEKFDFINVVEEVGDGFWYDAIIAKVCGVSFEEIQRKNIEKLRKRFPNKFTEYDATNRNLKEERNILEKDIDNI